MAIFLRTAFIAVAAGFLFETIGMFLPWLLGPMIALLLVSQFTKMELYWPKGLRTAGLVMLGVQIGASFTRDAVFLMWLDLPYMAFMTVSVVGLSILLGLLFKKMVDESLATSLLGSIPGGLAQMVVIAEEVKSANIAVVTMMQTIRIFMVVTIVPFLTVFLTGREEGEIGERVFTFAPLAFLAALAVGGTLYLGMKRIGFPAAELLAPILTMAIVQTVTGELLVDLPYWLIALAQVCIGAGLGLQMERIGDKLTFRLGAAIVLNNVLLISFTAFIAYILAKLLPDYIFLDFFLSAAPGGIAEMAITALATGGDVALITSFQLFRLFFILLIASPIVTIIVKKLDAKSGN
ncbi:AbrB family transcriptional regulator [Planococcus sp. APC 3906]|uniref:AbrB family transcriptional regulator n=1 Tax=Planococcus sp. APC 3906 TaxID=3035194 RepID=UPI0025B33B3C|nr:AbrB family transcriptional regulator [Planococcus sp. APC 3906]MDN3449159.1 AbrB family transcriptional regulator [Planococcus sp. APC 3906]